MFDGRPTQGSSAVEQPHLLEYVSDGAFTTFRCFGNL